MLEREKASGSWSAGIGCLAYALAYAKVSINIINGNLPWIVVTVSGFSVGA